MKKAVFVTLLASALILGGTTQSFAAGHHSPKPAGAHSASTHAGSKAGSKATTSSKKATSKGTKAKPKAKAKAKGKSAKKAKK